MHIKYFKNINQYSPSILSFNLYSNFHSRLEICNNQRYYHNLNQNLIKLSYNKNQNSKSSFFQHQPSQLSSPLSIQKLRFYFNQQKKIRSGFLEILSTPNPKSLQFKPIEPLFDDPNLDPNKTYNFSRPMEAIKSPLASRIFKNPWVTNVMIANHYFSVSISDEEQWYGVQLDISSIFQEWAMSGELVMDKNIEIHNDTLITDDDDEVVAAIKEVIETRIKPIVQKDGGDVRFVEFTDDGVVFLEMTGSCKGCPSSAMTLKNGIENMLQHFVPEVAEVKQLETEAEKESSLAFDKLEKKLGEGESLTSNV